MIPFNISYKACQVVLNFFSFFLSVKLLISPSSLNERFSSLSLYMYCATSFWSVTFLLEFQLGILMAVPLYLTYCYCLDDFNILSLLLTFSILNIMCIGVILFALILFGILCASCPSISVSFPRLWTFSAIMSSV